jgi:hypothetical protein
VGQLIVANPVTEQERNLNARYRHYRWLQALAAPDFLLAESFLSKLK